MPVTTIPFNNYSNNTLIQRMISLENQNTVAAQCILCREG